MELSRLQVDMVIDRTPVYLKGTEGIEFDIEFGDYRPSGANWWYKVGYIQYHGLDILVCKKNGVIL